MCIIGLILNMNFKVVCVYMSKNICEGFSWEREILFFFFFYHDRWYVAGYGICTSNCPKSRYYIGLIDWKCEQDM